MVFMIAFERMSITNQLFKSRNKSVNSSIQKIKKEREGITHGLALILFYCNPAD
jgi:hypothetical protein